MGNPAEENARIEAGASLSELAGGESRQNKFNCSADDIAKVVRELSEHGLGLNSASGATQMATLPKALQHRGPRGLSTYEAVAAGYLRIATRIKELKSTWDILTVRESYVGPDGLFHAGVARYVLIGRIDRSAKAHLTSTLAAHGVVGRGYADCTNEIYKPILGGKKSEVCAAKGLKKSTNLREVCLAAGITVVNRQERVLFARRLLDDGEPRPIVRDRLMARFGIRRASAYNAIDDALNLSKKREKIWTSEAQNSTTATPHTRTKD